MRIWTQLNIDVDYSPSDPGSSKWYTDNTAFARQDLRPGMCLPYTDSGGLFGALEVKSLGTDGITLLYRGKEYELGVSNSGICLDKDGRNYTNFELNVWLRTELCVEDTLEFRRKLYTKEGLALVKEEDWKAIEASPLPVAKFALGRRHFILAPAHEKSPALAEKYFREAAEAGDADALASLGRMYVYGEAGPGLVDMEKASLLLDEAAEKGSELARMLKTRERIYGTDQVEARPELVAAELEAALTADSAPRWWDLLARACHQAGRLQDAEKYFLKAIELGEVSAYVGYTLMLHEQERKQDYSQWMSKAMAAGCGWGYVLDVEMEQDVFDGMSAGFQHLYHNQTASRLERGLELGEEYCAYRLGINHWCGYQGFEQDDDLALKYFTRGVELADPQCCLLKADILEEQGADPEEVAFLRLKALRFGEEEARELVADAYQKGLLEPYREEIETYWLPDPDPDEGDDGRWDAYA